MEARLERLVRNQGRWGLAILLGMVSTQVLVLCWLGVQVWGIRQWRANTGRAVAVLRSGFDDTRRVLEIVKSEQQTQERRSRLLLEELDLLKKMLKEQRKGR